MELAPVTEPWGIARPEPGVIYHRPSDRPRSEGRREVEFALCTGPGTIRGSVQMAELLRTTRPGAVIAGGIAGGIGEGVEPGDVVVARETGFYDVDVTALGLPAGVLVRGGAAELEAPLWPDTIELGRLLREHAGPKAGLGAGAGARARGPGGGPPPPPPP
ncbi:MAG: hypothetical protein EA427_13445, partial [Spirochaetaceae bacterium]